MDFVWPPYPPEKIDYELNRMKEALESSLKFEVLFGHKGVDIYRSLAPHHVLAIAPQLAIASVVIDKVILQRREGKEFLSLPSPELHSISHAFHLLSVAGSMYHQLRAKFLLMEHAAVWVALKKASGDSGTAPMFPFDWEYEETSHP